MWGLVLALATASPSPLVCTSNIQDAYYCHDDPAIACSNQWDRARCPQTCGHACTFCNNGVLQDELVYCENNFDLANYDNLSHFEELCRSAYIDIGSYAEPEHVPYCTCMCKQFWANATTTTTTVSTTTTTTTVLPQYCTDPAHPAYNEQLNGFDDHPDCAALTDAGVSIPTLCADSTVFALCPSLCGHACTFCNADVLAAEDDLYNCTEIEAATAPAAACLNKTFEYNNKDYSVCSCTCRDAFDFTVTTPTPTTPTPTTTTPPSKSTSTAVPIALGVTAAVLVTAAAGGWWYSHRRKTGYKSTTNWL